MWLWSYLRRKTAESILAGIHDALSSGGVPNGLTDEQAATAGQTLAGGPPATGSSLAPADGAPPQLPAPATSESSLPADVRRGPGRPRKYQEPPP